MTDPWAVWWRAFDERLAEVACLLYLTRDIELQRAGEPILSALYDDAESMRLEMLAAGRMDEALRALGTRYLMDAFRAELRMYVLLKEGDPDHAWDQLVHAETAYIHAARAHRAIEAQIAEYVTRLARLEQDAFPAQVFMSAGLIVRRQQCSVCGGDYQVCEHIVGEIYDAEFCHIRLMDVTADHFAIVEQPANKMCRITHFSTAGGKRNRMTWAVTPDSGNASREIPDGAMMAEAVMMTASDIEGTVARY
ncbi:MAG: hypothetical protein JWR80_10143 [Bradyrhizobium sp.]|nr:hypothetical protein [Bradyrhizobium sp.]